MKIGFVIVNYNDSTNTVALIDNIKDYKSISHIVVVDNNSSLSSKSELKQIKSKKVTVLEQNDNLGYAYALNVGAKYLIDSLGPCLICLSNTDISIPSEEVINKLAMMIDDETKCVMPKIKENGVIRYGWRLTSSTIDLFLNIPLINRLFRNKYIHYDESYFQTNESIVDVIYGCFFMIDSSTLKDIDYFDEQVFLYYEEYILARKLKSIGKLSKINNEVYIEHLHNATIGSNISKLKKYQIYKKSQMYYEKNYNHAGKAKMLLFKLFYLINLIPYKLKSLKKINKNT